MTNPVSPALRKAAHRIHIGGVFASKQPSVVYTVLGSCISVCLRDSETRVGGMNHFMLPYSTRHDENSARYGIHAMELLINECMQRGAERSRLEAKVFGGGHVLRIRESDGNVPKSNIKFALEFLKTENIPIVSRDLGGYAGREIYYFTDSGKILLKRLQSTHSGDQLAEIEKSERAQFNKSALAVKAVDDNVTLF